MVIIKSFEIPKYEIALLQYPNGKFQVIECIEGRIKKSSIVEDLSQALWVFDDSHSKFMNQFRSVVI